MTNWKYNIYLADICDEYEKEDDDIINVKRCVDTVCERLILLKRKIEEDGDPDGITEGCFGIDGHIDNFRYFDFNGSQEELIDQFNGFMDDFYDFADWNFIWVNVMDHNMKGIGNQ
jgi:hypothetical protein